MNMVMTYELNEPNPCNRWKSMKIVGGDELKQHTNVSGNYQEANYQSGVFLTASVVNRCISVIGFMCD